MANISDGRDLRLFDSMMLLSVLSTAADVTSTIDRRRTGRDPRAQEDSSYVRAYLSAAVERLEEGFVRLFMQQVCGSEHATVRRMDQLLLVRRLTGELHLVHQRLLSLYPGVSEKEVEAVRLLEQRCEELTESPLDRFDEDLSALLDQGLRTAGQLRQVIRWDGSGRM